MGEKIFFTKTPGSHLEEKIRVGKQNGGEKSEVDLDQKN